MTEEQFFNKITKIQEPNINTFWNRIEKGAAVLEAIKITLEYPELAQKYLDTLPKAVMD